MALLNLTTSSPLVLATPGQGVTLIPTDTPLTRLNYFDGKFLRADDLQNEQAYLRQLVALSNQAGGAGIVHGLEVALAGGDQLELSAGLAIDPLGRVLLLPAVQRLGIADLVERSRAAVGATATAATGVGQFAPCEVSVAEAPPPLPGRSWYLVLLSQAEALCGEEDVVGMMCADACAGSTNRPYRLEGVRLRLAPLALSSPLPSSSAVALSARHLRSQIASAYFADEAAAVGSLISGAGLRSDIWCRGAAPFGGSEVALGVLVREGSTTRFVDAWTARRERIAMPPQRYWQQRMAMRPLDVFLAQVLQFQCQLRDVLAGLVDDGGGDSGPCSTAKQLVGEAAAQVQLITSFYRDTATRLAEFSRSVQSKALDAEPEFQKKLAELTRFGERLNAAQASFSALPANRLLIEGGIVEMPAAGWLPVVPGDSPSVNEQVQRLLGEGVDLRFCIVRPDFVPHAWEEAQHMERISLLDGLDHVDRKPKLDILVPDGTLAPGRDQTGRWYEMRMTLGLDNLNDLVDAAAQSRRLRQVAAYGTLNSAARPERLSSAATRSDGESIELRGAARGEAVPGRGVAFHFAGLTDNFAQQQTGLVLVRAGAGGGAGTGAVALPAGDVTAAPKALPPRASIWVSLQIDDDPATLQRGMQTRVGAEAYLLIVTADSLTRKNDAPGASHLLRATFSGSLRVDKVELRAGAGGSVLVDGEIAGELMATATADGQSETFVTHLSETVQITRTQGSAGADYRIAAVEPETTAPYVDELAVERQWTSAAQAECVGRMRLRLVEKIGGSTLRPEAGKALVAAGGKSLLRQLFHAWQQINEAVGEPAHPAHEKAIRALRSIGSALDGGRFADVKAALLFPPPPPASSNQILLATRDWVLFHRRREKSCQPPAQAAAPATRGYALYQAAVADERELAALQKAFAGNDSARLAKIKFDFLQVVEFAAGVQSVLSPPAQVRASWRQDVGAAAGVIVGGAIASRGAALAEGKALAAERAAALIDLLDAEFDVAAQPDVAVAARIPDVFAEGQNDGVLVLATLKAAVVTTCQTVYAVESEDLLKRIVAAAASGGLSAALADTKTVVPLGHVDFVGNTPEAADLATLKAAWPATLGVPSAAAVVRLKGDAAADSTLAQAKAMGQALGLAGDVAGAESATAPPECPAVTVFAGTVVRRNAWLIYGNWDRPNHFIPRTAPNGPMEFRNDVAQGNALSDLIAALTPNQPVLGVTLATTLAAPDGGAPARLQQVVQALAAAGRPAPVASRQAVEALNDHDRKEVQTNLQTDPNGFDEIIFLELNAGT
jgi:hypothetical protein